MFDWLKDIAGIASAGAGILGAFNAQREPKGAKDIGAASARANAIAEALSNPASPMFQNIAANERQVARDRLIESIGQIVRANRRAMVRNPQGPGFFVNPARRDEAVTRAISQGYENEGLRADERARGVLQAALGAQPVAQNLAGNYAGFNQALRRERDALLPSAFGGISDVLGRVGRSDLLRGLGAGAASASINEPSSRPPWERGMHGLLGSV